MAEIKKIKFAGWDNCYRLSAAGTEAVVTTDVGPRIISFSRGGKPNHMKVFDETAGKTGGGKFEAYGGHRVWHAPEAMPRSYQPDNSPCAVTADKDGVTVMSRESGTLLSKGFWLSMSDGGVLTVRHIIRNEGMFAVPLAVWGLSQLEHGGLLAVPNGSRDTGLTGNRAVALWPYSKMTDRRVYWGDGFITVTPDKKDTPAFKFGSTVDDCYAAYFNHGQLLVKRFDTYAFGKEYPSYYCNFESYTDARFIEMETLGPITEIPPGGGISHTERWYIADGVAMPARGGEDEITRALNAALERF